MNTIDPNVDYEALLTAAKTQWKIRLDKLESIAKAKYSHILAGGSMQDPEYQELEMQEIDAKIKYQNWIKHNITERGIRLHTNESWNNMPMGLSILVAG